MNRRIFRAYILLGEEKAEDGWGGHRAIRMLFCNSAGVTHIWGPSIFKIAVNVQGVAFTGTEWASAFAVV